jgi:hypothetical protein
MAKPKFDPTKPFQVVSAPAAAAKPRFNPSQPFTAADETDTSHDIEMTDADGLTYSVPPDAVAEMQATKGWKPKATPGATAADPSEPEWSDDAGLMPDEARALRHGLVQGGSLGFSDELGAATQAGLQFFTRSALNPDGSEMSVGDVYRAARTGNRAEEQQLRAEHPGYYTAGELAGSLVVPLPGGAAIKGAKGLTKAGLIALQGAGVGGLAAAGASEADDAGGLAKDIGRGLVIGGGTGALVGAGGYGLEKLQGKAATGIERAEADQVARQELARQKAIESARGALGQKSADVLQSRRVAKEAADELAATDPEFAELLRKKASDPAALARLRKAAENYLGRLDRGMEDIGTLEKELSDATARDPAAEAAEKLAHPVRDELIPRIKTYANRAIPSAVAGAIGGPAGVVAGTAVANTIGRPTTAMANAMQSPAVRKMGWEAVQSLVGTGERALQGTGRAVSTAGVLESAPGFSFDSFEHAIAGDDGEPSPYAAHFAAGRRMGMDDASTHFVMSQTDPGYSEWIKSKTEGQ